MTTEYISYRDDSGLIVREPFDHEAEAILKRHYNMPSQFREFWSNLFCSNQVHAQQFIEIIRFHRAKEPEFEEGDAQEENEINRVSSPISVPTS